MGDDQDEMLLCLVRGVRVYLKRTAPFRLVKRRLFISTSRIKKEVSKNTLSWLREVIRRAYSLGGSASPVLTRIKAHDIGGMGSSIAFKNYAVGQTLQAGIWKRQTTFTSFCLKELANEPFDTFTLGPVVAAQ